VAGTLVHNLDIPVEGIPVVVGNLVVDILAVEGTLVAVADTPVAGNLVAVGTLAVDSLAAVVGNLAAVVGNPVVGSPVAVGSRVAAGRRAVVVGMPEHLEVLGTQAALVARTAAERLAEVLVARRLVGLPA